MTDAILDAVKAEDKTALPKSEKHPEGLLKLGTKGEIEGAITIVTTGQYRGQDVPMSDEEKMRLEGRTVKADDGDASDQLSSVKAMLAKSQSTAIKALPDDRFGGYLAIWGHPNQKDLTGEYFTPETEGMTDLFDQLGKLPTLFHHGADKELKATLVGTIDTMVPDDVGVWVEGILNKRNRYVEGVKKLLGLNALGWSSGALPATVDKARDGRIKSWVIGEGTMTHTPAEPRRTGAKHLINTKALNVACKAMNIKLPDNLLEQDDESRRGQETARQVHAEAARKKTERKKDVDDETMLNVETTEDVAEDSAKSIRDAAQSVMAELAEMREQSQKATAQILVSQFQQLKKEIGSIRKDMADGQSSKTAPRKLPNPQPSASGHIEIISATKYSSLEPQDMAFLHEIMSGHSRNWNPGEEFYRELAHRTVKSVQEKKLPPDALKGMIEAMGGTFKANELDNVGQTGFGLEWAPDSWRAELWMRIRQDNIVAPLFDMIEMPTQPYELPIESTDPTVSFVPETTDLTQIVYGSANPIPTSKIASGKVQLSAKKLALRVLWSSELNEDSLIPIIGNYRRQSLRSLANAVDNVILNGDTATGLNVNVNLIDGTPTAGTKFLAFDGLRKYSLVTNPGQGKQGAGAPTLPLLRATRFLLTGAYALQPRNCAWIVDDSTYGALLNMPEFITMDKAGPNATNMTGQIGVLDGVPCFATAEMGLSQTGAAGSGGGKVSGTGANNTKGQATIVFRPNFLIGYRRQVSAVVEQLAWADAYHLTVTARLHFVSFDTKSSAELYDLTV